MHIKLISDDCEIREVGAPVAAGASIDNNSDIIDMADYESVLFIVPITDCVDTGVATITVQENDANSDTGMADVTDAEATATSAANDDLNDTVLAVEYRRAAKRYVQLNRKSATANIAYGNVIAILKPYQSPAVQGATVSDIAKLSN